jgi:hypothetical protein
VGAMQYAQDRKQKSSRGAQKILRKTSGVR